MKLKPPQTISIDVLVVGSGAAGLRAAIEARKKSLDVMLVSDSPVGFRNNTAISKAAFAAVGIWKVLGIPPKFTSGIPSPVDASSMTAGWWNG